jgi:hypothetical protein
MKYLFRLIRWPLGQIVIFVDWVTRPKVPAISPQKQAELDATTSSMQLYQFQMCPFCVKTRRAIRRLGLNIETRDARNDPQWSNELVNQGGGKRGWLDRLDIRIERHYRLSRPALRQLIDIIDIPLKKFEDDSAAAWGKLTGPRTQQQTM